MNSLDLDFTSGGLLFPGFCALAVEVELHSPFVSLLVKFDALGIPDTYAIFSCEAVLLNVGVRDRLLPDFGDVLELVGGEGSFLCLLPYIVAAAVSFTTISQKVV